MNQGMLSFDETKLERRSLARNEYLFRQGDKVRAIYFIEDGRLRLDRRTFDGRSLVKSHLPGFGEHRPSRPTPFVLNGPMNEA